jgi:glycosyltransferase involved in cell wall biosynthesis
MKKRPSLSIVVPFLNEESVLPFFREQLENTTGLPEGWSLILVSDGSTDGSVEFVESWMQELPRVKLLELSRNFGHQAAVTAGLAFADGEFVAVMDADLQDPPDTLVEMYEKAKSGFDVVYAIRETREGSLFKRFCYSVFYWIYGQLAETPVQLDSGDFCLLSRKAADCLNRLPETVRFVRGLRSWIGLKTTSVSVRRPDRAAGESKYGFWKLTRLAAAGLTSFSTRPLRLAMALGFGLCLSAIGLGVFYLIKALVFDLHAAAPGFATLVVLLLFLNGTVMLLLGILGEYLAQIFLEVKRRPTFLVDRFVDLELEEDD